MWYIFTNTGRTQVVCIYSSVLLPYLSVIARNLCLCVCVCVCLKYLCGSGSDWPESFHVAAAWFKGVQRRICLDYNDTVNNLFQKCFTNSASIANRSHHTCTPEPITTEPTATPHLKKQADLYLQRRELDLSSLLGLSRSGDAWTTKCLWMFVCS